MNNLRIVNVEVKSSTSINIEFSEKLYNNLIKENFQILSRTKSVPNTEVLSILVKNNIVYLTTQPLTPFVEYDLKAVNLDNNKIISLENKYQLSEDGVSNIYKIIGPIEDDNIFKNILFSLLKDSVYDVESKGTYESAILDSLSKYLDKALDDIKQVKNENYLFFDVIDEEKVRGSGPFDKLNEGSAFKITRVSKVPSTKKSTINLSLDTRKQKLFSLQQELKTELLQVSTNSSLFDNKNLIINLTKKPIIKINSIVFTFNNSNPIFEYDIEKYGYQIKENKYDEFAFKFSSLEDNQVKLSDNLFLDENFDSSKIIKIDVSYFYKNLSILPDESISTYSINKANYELIDPIVNSFNLKFAPIVNANGDSITSDGLVIKDTESKYNTKHPAFLYEIEYNLDSLPFKAGQFSVDYLTGKVFVYGDSLNNNGTTEYPPLISYNYKYSYRDSLDYTYDNSTYELAIMPLGNLIDTDFTITFNYESVLIENVDYASSLHEEVLNERINNNLLSLNVLKTENYPITNVFDIYNETTGEKYTLSRFSDNKVYFKYINPPNVKSITNELVNFSSISEELIVNDLLQNESLLNVAKSSLSHGNIISRTFNSIGNFTNTTFIPTDNQIFLNEYSYSDQVSYYGNINKLTSIGDYCVDYVNGIVYCVVVGEIKTLGFCNYFYSEIVTSQDHIISVDDVYYLNSGKIKTKSEYSGFSDNNIDFTITKKSAEIGLNSSYIYYNKDNYIGTFNSNSFTYGLVDNVNSLYGLYESLDFQFSKQPLNFATFCNFSDNNILIAPITKSYTTNVKHSIDGYYIEVEDNVYYKSNNIDYSFTVLDQSGNSIDVLSFDEYPSNKLYLDTSFENMLVSVSSVFEIKNLSNVIVDYSSGDLMIDYTYLADEILISYEYGDNNIDFRESTTIKKNDVYYVSYKVGALRDALIRNFGTLINIPELSTFDTQLERERYRDSIYAALSSFVKGSTSDSIKNIVYNIAHTKPNITESNLTAWELGYNLLEPSKVKLSDNFEFTNNKHGSGILIDSNDQYIKIPSYSNINMDEGTMSFWINPEWNGIDNLSNIKIKITYLTDTSYPIDHVYIGSNQKYLDASNYSNSEFVLNKSLIVEGAPSLTVDGVYVYYTDKWNITVIDGYTNLDLSNLIIQVSSDDPIFNLKGSGINSPNITSYSKKVIFRFTESLINYTASFNSDTYKYFIDTSADSSGNKNRLSLFKDPYGYICFVVIDDVGKKYTIKENISDWVKNELHQIAISWKIKTKGYRDELHLFIDGLEVKNNLRYSSGIKTYANQKYTTKEKDFILSSKNIVGSNDLVVTSGSSVVTSSINFNDHNILPGDILYIYNDLFNSEGYVIDSVFGQSITLTENLNITSDNIKYSVNAYSWSTKPSYSFYKNTVVSVFDYYLNSNDGYVNTNDNKLYSSSDFSQVNIGDLVVIDSAGYSDYYTVVSIGNNYLELDDTFSVNDTSLSFYIYNSSGDVELKSPRTLLPDYEFVSGEESFIKIKNGVSNKSIIIIQTLGLNFESINKKYYLWSDESQNIIKTQLPAPVDIDSVKIYKIILDRTNINQDNSTTIVNSFTSDNLTTFNPINSSIGRNLTVTISGSNINFSVSVVVSINGVVNYSTITEVLNFTSYGKLTSSNNFQNVNYITVSGDVTDTGKNYLSIECKETNVITHETSDYYPKIKYSYEVNRGVNLFSDGYGVVSDSNNIFSINNLNDYINITSPIFVAGFYKIINIIDNNSLELEPLDTAFSLPMDSFTDGVYSIIKSTDYRSGLQNGFFYFEPNNYPGEQYMLRKGFYEFIYDTYININCNIGKYLFIGSDFNASNQSISSLNNFVIYNVALTDIRSGEVISDTLSITKDYNSINGIKVNKNTLFFNNLDSVPIINKAPFYESDKKYIYSNNVVNENFGDAIYLKDYSIKEENSGYLSEMEGTIDTWISPIFDSRNDNNYRFYFDSFSGKEIELTSSYNNIIVMPEFASSIISIKTINSDIDYSIGSRLEISKGDTVEELTTSLTTNKLKLSKEVYQICSIKIVDNFSNIDYFDGGSISSDNKTIFLNKNLPSNNVNVKVIYKQLSKISNTSNKQYIILSKKLPQNNCKVKVKYIPKGMNGDRICLYKDKDSYLNFAIRGNSNDYIIRHPINWVRGTWHKVRISWKTNSKQDNMVMFIDGYKSGSITKGTDLILQEDNFNPTILGDGYSISLDASIIFKDKLNYFNIGSDYAGKNLSVCSIDNFKISDKFKKIYTLNNESIDPSYNGSNSYPVTKDLYTTYILDGDLFYNKIDPTKFIKIVNKENGLNEFVVDVFDNFLILKNNSRSKEIMELLISILKPANSRVFINYN